jgi:hypothetical protein
MANTGFLTRAHPARGSFGNQNAVGRRHLGSGQPIEDDLGGDHSPAHQGRCRAGLRS